MNNNLGTVLGGIALVVGLANSYFIYDLSKGKPEDLKSSDPIAANAPVNQPGFPNNNVNPMDPSMQPAPAPVPAGPPTSISFKKMEHDFGNVKQDSENPYEFEFTNTGKNPLIITDAKGSCGCTVPEYPKEPIAPGATSKIRVVYSPGKQEGQQTKNVTITANTEPAQTVINIKANVKK